MSFSLDRSSNDQTTLTCHPRDGPAYEFNPDPLLKLKIEHPSPEIMTFGLGIVAGWPRWTETINSSYSEFIEKVKSCFDAIDIREVSPAMATVYIYPVETLHITIATLRAVSPSYITLDDTQFISHFWKEIILSATQRHDWPKGKIILELENAQLGSNAGILLWKETSGNIQAMRSCLYREVEHYKEMFDTNHKSECSPRLRMQRESLNSFSIPDIIHTSFLRFFTHPITDGRIVQKRFGDLVRDDDRRGKLINEIFKQKIEISSISLVSEYSPYNLFPHEHNQVIWDCLLT